MNSDQTYKANGKFLLTAEYFVMQGSEALALPLRFGQQLRVSSSPGNPVLSWEAREKGKTWFRAVFQLPGLAVLESTDSKVSERIQQVLKMAGPQRFSSSENIQCTIDADFDLAWGLGSSSSFVYTISQWLGLDPFEVQFRLFGGSGYDIACAGEEEPLVYRLNNGKPQWHTVPFFPAFHEQLFFVYSGRKMDTREAISRFKSGADWGEKQVNEFSALTQAFIEAASIEEFMALMKEHETLLSSILGIERIKTAAFPDFPGEIKSLGGWGGDFVLAAGEPEMVKTYFSSKGLNTIFPYRSIVKNAIEHANH